MYLSMSLKIRIYYLPTPIYAFSNKGTVKCYNEKYFRKKTCVIIQDFKIIRVYLF